MFINFLKMKKVSNNYLKFMKMKNYRDLYQINLKLSIILKIINLMNLKMFNWIIIKQNNGVFKIKYRFKQNWTYIIM